MSEEMIINHCSPTLAGIKTGALFNCAYPSEQEMRSAVRSWNKTLSPKGLRVLPLRYNGRTALIYMYRPAMLSIDLKTRRHADFWRSAAMRRKRRRAASCS